MTETSHGTIAALVTASAWLQYLFAGVGIVGYVFSPTWMWVGIDGVAASVVLHLIVRYLHNRKVPPMK